MEVSTKNVILILFRPDIMFETFLFLNFISSNHKKGSEFRQWLVSMQVKTLNNASDMYTLIVG